MGYSYFIVLYIYILHNTSIPDFIETFYIRFSLLQVKNERQPDKGAPLHHTPVTK